jgi:uncharacterized protein YjbJ (UPF0337 family)
MRVLPLMVAVAGIGLAAYVIYTGSDHEYATGSGDAEDAAQQAFGWGTKQRVSGAASQLAGNLKKGVGRITGDDDLVQEGVVDQAAGLAKDAAGNVAQTVGETIHELSR